MRIYPFNPQYLTQAAELFVQHLAALRRSVPSLSGRLERPDLVTTELAQLFQRCPGVMAVEDGRLAGYLGWFIVERFRGADRRGANVPEWAHATLAEGRPDIYRALYRAAAEQWSAAGCGVMPSPCWRTTSPPGIPGSGTAYRGRKAAAALLDAALRDYGPRGFTCCAVDFESFNPEAAVFWPKYFELVAFSLARVPEHCPENQRDGTSDCHDQPT